MNFAEAIRRASREAETTPTPDPTGAEPDLETIGAVTMPQLAGVSETDPPEAPNASVAAGNVVRLELFLTAEQMSSMLRAIISGQHTVLTVPEAANYLRVRPQALTRMAEEGGIPGVLVDGKWRFPKNALDEWLANETNTPWEDHTDVA